MAIEQPYQSPATGELYQVKAIEDLDWQAEEDELQDILYRHLYQAALRGAESGLVALDSAVGADWGLVNEAVRAWARAMSLELVRGITDTSRRFVTQAIADWIQSGQPLDKLVEVLRPMYGPVRAEMIAATEVTRAYAEGNQVAWQESGVVAGMRWQSSRDELVCPICGPLHGQEVPLGSKFQHPESGQEYFPPAHVRCRCWIAPVVRS